MIREAGFEEIRDAPSPTKRPFFFGKMKTVNAGTSLFVRATQ